VGLAALLGNCSTLSSSTHVVVNELTTVAAAYALAPFASVTAGGTAIGTSATNITGLNNAFYPANNLVSYSSVYATPTNALTGMILPTNMLDTLGNILSACVNSTGSTSNACMGLITNTTVGTVAPIDTFQAALNIALHPGSNVPALFMLASTSPPFAPAIASLTPPADFTLAIGYNGYTISAEGAYALAIDSTGNAWVTANAPNTGGLGALMEITPSGQYTAGSGYQTPTYGVISFTGMAIDPSGVIWVASNSDSLQPTTTDAMIGFHPNGSVFNQFPVTFPLGVAVDGNGDIWSSNWTTMYSTFQELQDQSGTYTNNAVTVTTAESNGGAMCIGPMSRDVWEVAAGYNQGSAVTLYDTSAQTQTTIIPDAGGSYITGCAVDHAGNIWLADGTTFNGVEVYDNTGALRHSYAIAGQNAATGQFNLLQDLALDGLGNAFVSIFVYDQAGSGAATYPGRLVELSSSGAVVSPAYGYQPTSGAPNTGGSGLQPLTSNLLTSPGGIAIDGSGNVWLTGVDYYATGAANFVTQVLGIAAPVVTPKSLAVKNNAIANEP
jgi:sugar lactone lactonase YvrE